LRFPTRHYDPTLVYLLLSGGYAFLFTLVVSVNLVYQVEQAHLDPLQLVLVGTALEATIFLCEVPTGVVADVYSRRRSILVGLPLMGVGLALSGVFPHFWPILLSQIVWGFGYTFVSGARQAWIADEVGIEAASKVYLRSAQVEQALRLIAIPISIAMATVQLNLPIVIGGGLFVALGLVLRLTMSETGFRGIPKEERASFAGMTSTFVAGSRLVRRSPLLITVFCIAAFYGMASEGFDRLWVKQFYDNLGFPGIGQLEPVIWFGVIRMGTSLLSLGAVELVRRRLDTNSHAVVSRWLFAINALQVASFLVFALAGSFTVGMLAFWCAVTVSYAYDPLRLAWLNQNIESRVRATVISMNSQVDAIGQIAGGPVLGAIGSWVSLRAALAGAAVVLSPALLLYLRAFGQGRETNMVETSDVARRPSP
jgi:MFS transporter, DHA3 family, tetracycline resistance protein